MSELLTFDCCCVVSWWLVCLAYSYTEEHPEEIKGIGCSMEQAKAQRVAKKYLIKKEPAVIGGDRFWQNNGKPTNR